ncbi:uncharacterized protein LOC110991838 isoform X2 [Pieris rapae]|uniref:uncharacterized protein LOC110991838 isoform X2 n=1 Tax=Pieris rapae TaxID=64459 RepID=UPI001E27DE89|nr:uncharacterized protein LOC110991838 isoform X2 [Pieris rapae]
MEAKEESSSMRNIQEQELVNVEHNSSKDTLKERGQGDGDDEVCETTSNEKETFTQIVQRSADTQSNTSLEPNDQQTNSVEHVERSHMAISIYENSATSSHFIRQASCSKNMTNSNDFIDSCCEKAPSESEKTSSEKTSNEKLYIQETNEPSTSGLPIVSTSKCESTSCNSEGKENKKRPSTLRLKRPVPEGEDSSSDTGNDDYSLGSEDGCIYTYRGGEHLADLPSSFFSLDMGLPLTPNSAIAPAVPAVPQAVNNRPGSRASSPDMDFLEMDFDPGPSCEADTGDESTPEADIEVVSVPEVNEHVIRGTSPEYQPGVVQPLMHPVAQSSTVNKPSIFDVPSTSSDNVHVQDHCNIVKKLRVTRTEYITHVNVRGECLRVRRTMANDPNPEPNTAHGSSGDLVSAREILNYNEEKKDVGMAHKINQGENATIDSVNLTTALYHVNMAKRLMTDQPKSDEGQSSTCEPEPVAGPSQASEPCVEAPRCMVWSEREACERQVTQIGTSACGATAIVNVFLALGVPVNTERINVAVGTRQRANNAPIPRYLLSRSVAGCTASDIVTGIQKASDGLVTARFFPTYPERSISLLHWLADWISLGAVPILTLNLQLGSEGEVPDAWHHQMVFGVSPRGVYLCNPVVCVSEGVVWSRLVSPSVLLVRSRDIVARFDPETDMSPLTAVPDVRFHRMNVLGQVANVLREWRYSGCTEADTRTRHIAIPASYQAGITVAALTGSEAHRRLMHAPHLTAYTEP